MIVVFYEDESIVRDSQYDGKKCGAPGSSHRVFELRGNDARIENCLSECKKNKNCVAFSGDWRQWCNGKRLCNWCIGCDMDLTDQHSYAIAFRRKGKSF